MVVRDGKVIGAAGNRRECDHRATAHAELLAIEQACERMDSVDDSSEEVEERPKKKGKSEDWDELLTSYEEYVDKYISFAKKAAQGDMRALAKYPSLMQKAEDLSEKLEGAEDDMSAAQLARYTKISIKLMKAAEELAE